MSQEHEGHFERQQLSDELNAIVEQELEPGEIIRWFGQPDSSRYFARGVPEALFGIPFTAFAVFWTVAASAVGFLIFGQGFVLVTLFGLSFVVVGLGMLSSPFSMVRKAWRTAYVVTDRRAIVFDGGPRATTIRSFRSDQLRGLRRVQRSDGSGDLIFEQADWNDGPRRRRLASVGFFAIRDVLQVEKLIREISMLDR